MISNNDFSTSRERGSVILFLAFALAALSCAASVYLFYRWNGVIREKAAFEQERSQYAEQIASLETDLQAALKDRETFKKSEDEAKQEKERFALELAEAKAAAETQQSFVNEMKLELEQIQNKLKMQELAPMASSGANGLIEPSSGAIVGDVNLVTAPQDIALVPMKVKTINRTFNFVVFDLASGYTPRVGDTATIERSGEWIADVKIKQVYAKFASAEIRKESDENLLQIGDTIIIS